MKKLINKVNKMLVNLTDILTNVFMFTIISGLLFNDPFGTIETISGIISNIGERGMAGIISLIIIVLVYKRKR